MPLKVRKNVKVIPTAMAQVAGSVEVLLKKKWIASCAEREFWNPPGAERQSRLCDDEECEWLSRISQPDFLVSLLVFEYSSLPPKRRESVEYESIHKNEIRHSR